LLVLLRKPLFATAKRQLPRTLCDIKSKVTGMAASVPPKNHNLF